MRRPRRDPEPTRGPIGARHLTRPSAPASSTPASSNPERQVLELPVVELALDLGRRPVGLVPQGRDGSLLLNLGPLQVESGAGEGDAVFFDALHRKWRLVRIGERSRSTKGPDRPAAEVPWSFGVHADGDVHPAGLHSAKPWSPRGLEVEPRTGFLSVLDLQGRRTNLHRLYSKRPRRRRSSLERSLVLEILSVERTADGALPSVGLGERFAIEWVPIASLESRESWLFVSIETPRVSLAIR